MTREEADTLTATLVLMGAKRKSLVPNPDLFRLYNPEILIEIKSPFHGYVNPNDLIVQIKTPNNLAMNYDTYEFNKVDTVLEKITQLQKVTTK